MPLDLFLLLENDFLVFLPRAHLLQIPSCFGDTSGVPVSLGELCSEGVQTFYATIHMDQLYDVLKHEWNPLKPCKGLSLEPQYVQLSLDLRPLPIDGLSCP